MPPVRWPDCAVPQQAIYGCGIGAVLDSVEQLDRPGVIQWHPVLHLPTTVWSSLGLLHWWNAGLHSSWQGETAACSERVQHH